MIVVDTNVIAYLWIPGERTQAAVSLFSRDPEWVAPLLWRSEFRNVLATSVRRGNMDLPTALELMQSAEDLLQGREYTVPSEEVLRCAAASGCAAYDCEFVVLAQELQSTLVTSDRRLLDAFPTIAQPLTPQAPPR